jgi:CheY-like chemotaxis protein
MTYRILFIDEQKEAHRDFAKQFLQLNKERFTGESVFPSQTLDEMIDVIFNEIKPDAILTDYSLNVHKSAEVNYDIEYDGSDLANRIQSKRQDYPIFITTSLSTDAAQHGADAKIIYDKSRFGDKEDSGVSSNKDLTFAERLFYAIKGYKKQLDDWSTEFDEIFKKKSQTKLTEPEEARLIELDSYLENALDQESKLPDSFKLTSNAQKLEELIALTKQVLGHE